MTRQHLLLALAVLVAGCDNATGPDIESPANLRYRVDASGDPDAPAGILLEWDGVGEGDLSEYRVYSRATDGAKFDLRASTTSTTFHDVGQPDLDYYVTAVVRGGDESEPSNTVRVDFSLMLESPNSLTSISLNSAIHLAWSDNPFENAPSGFRWYRVYSTSYSLDDDLCGTSWSLEGTTVSAEFLAANLSNGVPRCFAVSAESIEGFESDWSPLRADTPRPDARNILLYPFTVNAAQSGFRFWLDGNGDGKATTGELGLVRSGSDAAIDFRVDLVGSAVYLHPVRSGTEIALYGDAPVEDLTDIDVAPTAGFEATDIEAVPGWGYVFQMSGGDGFARFGALRVTHASPDYLIFDWSYQTDPGNPELSIGAGVNTYRGGVTVIRK